MYKVTSLIALVLASAVAGEVRAAEPDTWAQLSRQFANPSSEFGTAPFLVWNGEVTEEDIDRTLAEYKARGFGGVFIHPRPGLITPYLNDRWFWLVRYTVETGKRLGMKIWLYDENSYPSGFAGGHVPDQMPESWNQGQALLQRRVVAAKPETARDCKYVLVADGNGFREFSGAGAPPDGALCYTLLGYPARAWNAGFPYVDLIKPGVTEKFIEVTMRGYEKTIGAEFGKTVPGIFTDEPNINPPGGANAMRWTPDLFEQFEKRFGYSLKQNLPSLFGPTGDYRKVRHDYFALLLDLFVDRWAKPWHAYTTAKGFHWTGHYWEHGWPSPKHLPDNMALYAWHHTPAIDMLFNQFNEGVNAQFGNVRSVKELASVANQTGARRALSETYGGGGWELRFEDMKRLGDWEYALGVNLMNQHLSFGTMAGWRKQDYPPSFSYHSPWWNYHKPVGDYFARLSLALSSGRQVNRVLVFEPTTSAWMYSVSGVAEARMMEIGDQFQAFITKLEHAQGEYDLASEHIVRNLGKASKGLFTVGKRDYSLVVLAPGTENLEGPTLKLLEAYLASGGRVLAFVDPPARIDGKQSAAAAELATRYAARWTRLQSLDDAAARKALLPTDIATQGEMVFHHRRVMPEGEMLFFVNSSLEQTAKAEVRVKGALTQLDPLTGAMKPVAERSFTMPPAGSLLLFAAKNAANTAAPAKPEAAGTVVAASGSMKVRRAGPNVLAIDYCDLKLGDKEEKGLYHHLAADKAFRYHGFDGNPWSSAVQFKTATLDRNRFEPGSGFEATYWFEVEPGVPLKGLELVVERSNLYQVTVNGKRPRGLKGHWWLDRSTGVFDLDGVVVEGSNQIRLAAHPMSVHAEIERVYVRGSFRVVAAERGWKLAAPKPMVPGSWKAQGHPLFSGQVVYSQTYSLKKGGRYTVRLPEWSGTVAEVRVNGKPAGIIGWQPYEADISAAVSDGENTVDVVVVGSLKNLLGPHHGKINRGLSGPGSFRVGPQPQPSGAAYDLLDYGLMKPFEVVAR